MPALFVNRRPVALLARRDNPQGVVWQWPLQRCRFVDRARKPCVPFLRLRQKHRHGLGMDRAHDVVGFRRQEREEAMRAGLALPLAAP